jgi:hypothetical protein
LGDVELGNRAGGEIGAVEDVEEAGLGGDADQRAPRTVGRDGAGEQRRRGAEVVVEERLAGRDLPRADQAEVPRAELDD